MALSPKESGEFIAKNARHVTIHSQGVEDLSQEVFKKLAQNDIKLNGVCDHECYPRDLSEDVTVNWLCVLDALNYCFWTSGAGKWEVTWNDKKYTGYFALCAAVKRAIEEGVDITNPKVYSKLSLDEVEHILRGDTSKKIPLLKERTECLHQVGKVLLEKYEGSFLNCVKACNKSAQALLKLIITEFECFNDLATYKDKTVSFHKRAQILVADIWCQFGGKGLGEFTDIDTITMFADYRVPQALINFGVISYSDELMKILKSNKILDTGCEYEVEIRGCSIEAIERVKQRVDELMEEKGKKYLCNSILIDNFLWLYRRKCARALDPIPFHRVISIYY